MQMQYRRHEQPGCGGCLLLLLLLSLLTGGAPALFQFLGILLSLGLFIIFGGIALFWGATYLIRQRVSAYERSQSEAHNTFVVLLVGILVKICQADGEVTREETATIYQFFRNNLHYSQSQIFWVKELVREALANPVNLDLLLAEFKKRFAYEPRLILLDLIYQVIFSKERVLDVELQLADNIARFLEITVYDQQAIKARYLRRSSKGLVDEERYFQVLGVAPGADWEQIKKAYRQCSMQYHPDKVAHLGDEFLRVAEEKMKDLNQAYQYLEKKYRK